MHFKGLITTGGKGLHFWTEALRDSGAKAVAGWATLCTLEKTLLFSELLFPPMYTGQEGSAENAACRVGKACSSAPAQHRAGGHRGCCRPHKHGTQ